jgi:hypothetical protein
MYLRDLRYSPPSAVWWTPVLGLQLQAGRVVVRMCKDKLPALSLAS